MGGGASKRVEPYVLRCLGEDELSRVGTPPRVSKKGGSAAAASSAAAAAAAAAAASSPFKPQHSSAGPGGSAAPPSADMLLASSSPPVLSSSLSRKGNMTRSISQLGSGEGLASFKSRAVYSTRFSWLVKEIAGICKLDQLDIGRVIGTGLMGTVRIAKLKDKGAYVALKAIRKDYIVKHRDQEHVENERRILLTLQSPFCIRLFGTFQDGPNVYFAMELAVGGELFRRLSKGHKDGLPAQEVRFYVTEIFSALEHVQGLGFVYRDLKPENVMLDEDGHCKLVDFGFATSPDANGIIRTLCGTPAYLSPEQLNGKFTSGYHKSCDWWALGVIVYELMTGKTPFCNNPRESSYEIYLRILKNKMKFPRSWRDPQGKELVQQLCHPSMEKRLVDPQIIKANPYFTIPWASVTSLKMVPPFVPNIKDEKDRDRYFRRHRDAPIESADAEGRLDLDGF